MTTRSLKLRLTKLAGGLTPLQRANDLYRRNVALSAWPDAELEAWCTAYCRDLVCLTNAELERLIVEAV